MYIYILCIHADFIPLPMPTPGPVDTLVPKPRRCGRRDNPTTTQTTATMTVENRRRIERKRAFFRASFSRCVSLSTVAVSP